MQFSLNKRDVDHWEKVITQAPCIYIYIWIRFTPSAAWDKKHIRWHNMGICLVCMNDQVVVIVLY